MVRNPVCLLHENERQPHALLSATRSAVTHMMTIIVIIILIMVTLLVATRIRRKLTKA